MADTNDDISLLSRINNGEQAAYEELYNSLSDDLYKIAFNVLKDEGDARDAVLKTFSQLVRKHSQIRFPKALNSWMRTTARNSAINIRRKKNNIVVMDNDELMRQADKQGANYVDYAENLHIIDCLQKLPEDQRKALMLKYEGDLTFEQVSKVMGLSVARVRKLLEKGEKNFKYYYSE